jgi:hypothetical protein
MGMKSRIPRDRFFFGIAWLVLGASIAGFSKTFFLPLALGRFHPLGATYVHAFFLFGWVALFFVQATLVRARAIRWHRRVGAFGVLVALGVAATTIAMGIQSVQRDIAAGGGEPVVSNVVGAFSAMLLFLLLVALAIAFRKRPDYHARLMLLATLHVLWPAWFRFRHFFPSVPFPEIVFAVLLADAWIVLAMARDRMKLGHVHPALLWGGLGVIAEHAAEAALFDSHGWRALGRWLMGQFA